MLHEGAVASDKCRSNTMYFLVQSLKLFLSNTPGPHIVYFPVGLKYSTLLIPDFEQYTS